MLRLKRARQFLGGQRVHDDFVDVDAGQAVVQSHNGGKDIIPNLVVDDGSVLVEPSNAELAAKLGLQSQGRSAFYDLVVVGSGPAGLTAALYAACESLSVLVVERAGVGAQAGVTERLDNFPGFPEGVTGEEFAARLRQQAERFGAEVLPAQEVTEVGAGVHFCATCDGPFYRGRRVVVIGGGNSAGEEGVFLTRFAEHVTVVARERLSASQVVVHKLEENAKVGIVTGTTPTGFATTPDGKLRALLIESGGTPGEISAEGAFVFIGLTPNSGPVAGQVDLDDAGFVCADAGMQTSWPTVFVAGDLRSGSARQAASAAGRGRRGRARDPPLRRAAGQRVAARPGRAGRRLVRLTAPRR